VPPHGSGGTRLRSTVKAALRRTGLLGSARRARDAGRALRWVAHNRRYLAGGGGDGLPVPPASLRQLTTASPSIAWFLESGRVGADSIRTLLDRHEIDPRGLRRLLDFGCGCGRVLRHWADTGIAVEGCDYNAALVAWCQRHLPFARVERNGLEPPLPYPAGRFALVYALSVFTHLPDALQDPWIAELHRVIAPGGHLIVSTHGEGCLDALTPAERRRFAAGELVVRNETEPGSNRCGVFASPDHIRRRFAPRFAVVEHRTRGALGNPPQDLVLLRALADGPGTPA